MNGGTELRACAAALARWVAVVSMMPPEVLPGLPSLEGVSAAVLLAFEGADAADATERALHLLDALAAWRAGAESAVAPEHREALRGLLVQADAPSARLMCAAFARRNALMGDPKRSNRSAS